MQAVELQTRVADLFYGLVKLAEFLTSGTAKDVPAAVVPTLRWLRTAEKYGPMNDLTPAEQRELYLASAERKRELWKK